MGPKIRDLHTFGVEFENTMVIFEICVLEFVLFQILVQKQKSCKKIHEKTKMPKFGTKNALFGYFWARIFKTFCHIWNQHPRICQIAKFRKKMKMSNFGTKNALFEYFGAGIYRKYCDISNEHSRICLIAKFGEKWHFLNLEPKMPYLSIFRLELQKNILIFEISTLEFL